MKTDLKIAIIDSGVDRSIIFNENRFIGYSIKHYLDTYQVVENDCTDQVGHGTAVTNILNNNLSNVEFSAFKIYDEVLETEEDRLIFTLNHILHNHSFDIIHISSGLVQSERYNDLYDVCEKLHGGGTCIVSAYDNDGAISYPAAFPFVIGVDLSDEPLKITEYEYVENSIINIRASSAFHRLRWTNPPTMLSQGTSFSSVYITLKVAESIRNGCNSLNGILGYLKNNAKKTHYEPSYITYDDKFVKSISKAIVFPFNKEIHSLASNKDCLGFEIVGFYDSKYSMNVGKSISEILKHVDIDDKVYDISNLLWDSDFDTVILGHCSRLNALSKKDWTQYIVNKAKEHGKKIFSLEEININDNDYRDEKRIYYPYITSDMVPQNRFGKLRSISKPVLGVFGTSSQQGKFTLQVKLRKMFFEAGYKVAQIGTEPQSQLFGIERVYPIGYSSSVYISGIESITLLNEYMWDISQNADIVLVGSQSGTVPYSFNHLSLYPIYQNDFLFGTQPDYVILCVNPHDPVDYICRTIKYIEGAVDTQVIALVLFPIIQDETDIGNQYKKRRLDKQETECIINNLNVSLGLEVFSLDNEIHMTKLFQYIIDLFSGDEE